MEQIERRALMRAAGICGQCQTRPRQEGRVQCPECIEAKRELRAEYKRQGRCASCGGMKDNPQLANCEKCRGASQARKAGFAEQGLCFKCGKCPPVESGKFCEACKATRTKMFKQRYDGAAAAGVCRQCLGPVPEGRASCDSCLEAKKRHNRKLKAEVFEAYGGFICACCQITEPMFLQIDHVERDGYKLRKEQGLGASLYQWLKRNDFPSGYQVLCANCNHARSRKDNPSGMCPHELARQELTALAEVPPAYQAA